MMKLYTSVTSPFGRKCRMAAFVAGVTERVEVVEADYKSEAFRAINPLGKVPALERDDATVLIDSPVICAYLASLGDADKVYPAGDAKWDALGLEALADGLTDAAILVYLERARDVDTRSDAYIAKQADKAYAALDALDAMAADFGARLDIGVLAVAAGIGWIELRDVLPDLREGRPNLAAWLERFAESAPMAATAPPPEA